MDIKKFIKEELAALKQKLTGKKALLALSGGVDSAVCAALIHAACPESLTCVFVDHGFMRKNEPAEVMSVFKDKLGLNVIKIDAEQYFLERVKGVTEPEQKRKIIGEAFIRIFEQEAKKIGAVDFFVQGTIYPDIVESEKGHKAHHNVGGLPSVVDFKEMLEPVKLLYKPQVREVGKALGLPDFIVMRQPFPGPGLAVRCIGELKKERLDLLREADFIYRDEIKKAGLDTKIWQYFAVLTDIKSTGVSNDKRTYANMLALRAVNSTDAMTADWAQVPHKVLAAASKRITDELPQINRVVYDITSKPPATIEWE